MVHTVLILWHLKQLNTAPSIWHETTIECAHDSKGIIATSEKPYCHKRETDQTIVTNRGQIAYRDKKKQ